MNELHIDYRLPGYNEAHNEARTHWSKAARTKKQYTDAISWLCKTQKLEPVKGKVNIDILWGTYKDRRDPDNVYSGVKYILDGLVLGGVLEGDTKKYIGKISHDFDDGTSITIVRLEQ